MINDMLIRTVLQPDICLVPFMSGQGYFAVLYIIKDSVGNFMCTVLKLRETLSQGFRVLTPGLHFPVYLPHCLQLSSLTQQLPSLAYSPATFKFKDFRLLFFFFNFSNIHKSRKTSIINSICLSTSLTNHQYSAILLPDAVSFNIIKTVNW